MVIMFQDSGRSLSEKKNLRKNLVHPYTLACIFNYALIKILTAPKK